MKVKFLIAAMCVLCLLPIAAPSARAATTCQLSVPPSALSATGLATPWQLIGCHEADPGAAVFVQAVIFNPADKSFATYSPLVIDQGTAPAVAPTPPTLPTGAVVALFGGGDDDVTQLVGASAQCMNGADGKLFGQVFFCHAPAFFKAVNAAGVSVPGLGNEDDGKVCPSVRDFRIVDQDQSDNVQTTYLAQPDGTTAQNTAANRSLFPTATVIKNGSDNRLLTNFVDPALGCHPWLAPDLADNGNLVPVQALDELQAAAYQLNPKALIPAGDPMVGPNDLAMLNAYRRNVDQPQVSSLAGAATSTYCGHLTHVAPPWLTAHQSVFQASASPTAGQNLYDFLTGRFVASLSLLGC